MYNRQISAKKERTPAIEKEQTGKSLLEKVEFGSYVKNFPIISEFVWVQRKSSLI